MPIHALPLVLFACALLGVADTTAAAPGPVVAQATESKALTRDEAARKAAEETGGKVLAADPDDIDGRPVYRVKVLTPDGHVRTVVIEAGAR
jgi:uncharacterized membrane protein YkoI